MDKRIIQIINNNGLPELIKNFKLKYNQNKPIELQLKYYHNLTLLSCQNKNKSKKKLSPIFKYDNDKMIGYIKFMPFEREFNNFDERDKNEIVLKVIDKLNTWLKKNNPKGLIIDIRGFYGWEKVIIDSLKQFLGNITLYGLTNKNTVSFKNPIWINYRFDKIREFPEVFYNSKTLNKIPLVFLIDQTTKKEGELIALIFKNRNNMYLIGEKTKGELFYNECFQLYDNKTLSLITKYYVDINKQIYDKGFIEPDIYTNQYMKIAYNKILG